MLCRRYSQSVPETSSTSNIVGKDFGSWWVRATSKILRNICSYDAIRHIENDLHSKNKSKHAKNRQSNKQGQGHYFLHVRAPKDTTVLIISDQKEYWRYINGCQWMCFDEYVMTTDRRQV